MPSLAVRQDSVTSGPPIGCPADATSGCSWPVAALGKGIRKADVGENYVHVRQRQHWPIKRRPRHLLGHLKRVDRAHRCLGKLSLENAYIKLETLPDKDRALYATSPNRSFESIAKVAHNQRTNSGIEMNAPVRKFLTGTFIDPVGSQK